MAVMDTLVAEMDREFPTTRRVLDRVPGDRLAWKPHERSMSLGALAWHLATIPGFVASSIVEDEVDFTKRERQPQPDTAAAILAGFDANAAQARQTLADLGDAKALATWTGRVGDKVVFSVPRVGFARTILLNHSYHHRGQLSVYLRLLDVKVPSIYGPSADDNPFA